MKRRKFLTQAAIASATTTTLAACSQTPQTTATDSLPTVEWRMATSWPQSLDTIYGGAETVCNRIKEITGGRFTITPFAAGEIVGGLEVLDAVQTGAVEAGHTASYYYIGKNPALAFGTTVPFGLTAQQQNAWLYHGGGLEAMHKLYSDFNIINFPAGNTGGQMGGWFKQEIQTVSDLEGLKMRIPGLGGKVMEALGVNVQVLPGGEIFLALDRGAIDAAEFVSPYDDEKLGLQNAADFYYYPGWWEPGATLETQVNLDAWNNLPKEYQEAFKTAAREANINMLAKYDALNQAALTKLVEEDGVQLTPYSQEIMEAAQEAAFDIYEQDASNDATFKEIYENWQQFRDQVMRWNQINQLSFTNFVTRK
ncbi:TRAP transporter substrate-binding protein [Spirulina sp. CS-785/01]|uniref:TRAP transporter substrate-binding protein n=1 Tax=Spirulina sp. CS-785/01 TaxID=3021716 RepID=UPI00232CDD90|nr:TRAP transporter substrate-binding protein [Spirulina sp. CS-785/01]MDB9314164.1 TRAP transporter substrate-binding protein [Spirulina sp. CS-785/01]